MKASEETNSVIGDVESLFKERLIKIMEDICLERLTVDDINHKLRLMFAEGIMVGIQSFINKFNEDLAKAEAKQNIGPDQPELPLEK